MSDAENGPLATKVAKNLDSPIGRGYSDLVLLRVTMTTHPDTIRSWVLCIRSLARSHIPAKNLRMPESQEKLLQHEKNC